MTPIALSGRYFEVKIIQDPKNPSDTVLLLNYWLILPITSQKAVVFIKCVVLCSLHKFIWYFCGSVD